MPRLPSSPPSPRQSHGTQHASRDAALQWPAPSLEDHTCPAGRATAPQSMVNSAVRRIAHGEVQYTHQHSALSGVGMPIALAIGNRAIAAKLEGGVDGTGNADHYQQELLVMVVARL